METVTAKQLFKKDNTFLLSKKNCLFLDAIYEILMAARQYGGVSQLKIALVLLIGYKYTIEKQDLTLVLDKIKDMGHVDVIYKQEQSYK
jgi:hypothetical protein